MCRERHVKGTQKSQALACHPRLPRGNWKEGGSPRAQQTLTASETNHRSHRNTHQVSSTKWKGTIVGLGLREL